VPDKPQNDPPERPPSPLMVKGTGRPDALNGFAVTFNPIRTPRAFEVICDQIRERLLAGVLKPGMKLPTERELAEQFGVSRSAVREAMRTLENARVVTLKKGAHGGAFVCAHQPRAMSDVIQGLLGSGVFSLEDLTEARLLVQDTVVRLACTRATNADFKALELNIDRTEEATRTGRVMERIELSAEFYRLLAAATGNKVLALLTESLSTILLGFLRMRIATFPDVVPVAGLVESRRRFLEYFVARDADRASHEITMKVQELHRHLLRSSPRAEDRGLTA
jgi:GntR family transcriptional regulator, transcriptional repressor for pyruvate dehydrogenase complex